MLSGVSSYRQEMRKSDNRSDAGGHRWHSLAFLIDELNDA